MSREGPHLLFCAFAEVPGPTSAGTRVPQLVTAFSDEFDVDAMTLKGPDLAHIQRMGTARVMRVPTEGKPFEERLASYRRALQRQISGDDYDFVYCADLFSAQVAAAFREVQGFPLVVEVSDIPSESFHRRWPVDPDDKRLKKQWRESEAQALRQASHVIAPSRHAARELVKRTDPRRVHLFQRAVDRTVFSPPSIEIADGRQTVAVIGREAGARLAPTIAALTAICEAVPDDVRVLLVGQAPPEGEDSLKGAVEATGLAERVELVDVETHVRTANVLSDAEVVVVLSVAETGAPAYAVPHRALEAMACRRATVLTGDAETFQDSLVPEEEAIVVPAQEPRSVAAAVMRLLDSPSLRDAIANAGMRRVEHECDLVLRTQELAAFITETIGVAMTPRTPESTVPAVSDEPTGAGDTARPTDDLPPPPFDTQSGRNTRARVVVGDAPARPPPSSEVSSPFDALEPVATDVHQVPAGEASSVFTEEESLDAPLAPAAPPAPLAADRAASSVDASALESAQGESPLDTIVAPGPPGLESLRLEQVKGLGSLEPQATRDRRRLVRRHPDRLARRPPRPPDLTPSAGDGATRGVDAEPPTSSLSGLDDANMKSIAAEQRTQSGDHPASASDPWMHDTIADAGPVFTDEKEEKKVNEEREEEPAAADAADKAAGEPPFPDSQRTISVNGPASFLVDAETERHAANENPALDDQTLDEGSLPQESSDG